MKYVPMSVRVYESQINSDYLLPSIKLSETLSVESSHFVSLATDSTDSHFIYASLYIISLGRDSSVGKAIRYGLDGPGIESRWVDESFRTRPART
jgi:hypothetical protein